MIEPWVLFVVGGVAELGLVLWVSVNHRENKYLEMHRARSAENKRAVKRL
jgi:hypothetical protein